MTSSRAHGFTLIELMITLVIVAILVSIGLPMFENANRRTHRTEAKSALMQVMTIQERYYTQNNTYKEFEAGTEDTTFKWYSGTTPQSSYYEISARACENSTIEECVALYAEPGGKHVIQGYHDRDCGTLVLTSRGEKSIISNKQTSGCWE